MEELRDYREFATVIERSSELTRLHVLGDVDIAYAQEFEAAIDDALSQGEAPVLLDFRGCRYMDSTALTAIVRAVKRHGPRLRASVVVPSAIERIMKTAAFEQVLPIDYINTTGLHIV